MAVAEANLQIEKGTDFEAVFYLSGDDAGQLNLISHTASAKLRKYPSASSSYSFTTSIDIVEGSVKIEMSRAVTATLPSGRCCFDILLTDTLNNIRTKAVTGTAIVGETSSL